MSVAIQIVNYNVPESVDKLVKFIVEKVKIDYFFTIIDNGSDTKFISKYTTKRLDKNRNKLGGVLAAMEESKKRNPDCYWTISTSMEFNPINTDPALELMSIITSDKDIVGVSPSFTGDLTDPPHYLMRKLDGRFHEALGSIGMFSMYKADWILGNGFPDSRLTSSWGTDYEMKYKAKFFNKKLMLSDLVSVNITKGTAYKSGRTKKSLDLYEQECRKEMETVLTNKYGIEWKRILGVDYYA